MRLHRAHAEEEQQETRHARDEKRLPPGKEVAGEAGCYGTQRAQGSNKNGSVSATFYTHALANERHTCAEFTRESDAREEPHQRVAVHILHPGVGDVGQRVQHDECEKAR